MLLFSEQSIFRTFEKNLTYRKQKVEKDLFYKAIVKNALLLSPMGLFWKGGNEEIHRQFVPAFRS